MSKIYNAMRKDMAKFNKDNLATEQLVSGSKLLRQLYEENQMLRKKLANAQRISRLRFAKLKQAASNTGKEKS